MAQHPVALVTGGGRGIGRAIATSLGRRGVDVVVTYRHNRTEAQEAVEEAKRAGATRAAAVQLDLADTSSFEAFAAKLTQVLEDLGHDRLDYLVNNAGTGVSGRPITDIDEAQFDSVVAIDLKGTFFLTQKLIPLITDGGRIVTITSSLARVSLPGAAAYAMTKGALEVFTRYLAKELGPRRITANAIAPGPIETDFGDGWVRDAEFQERIIPTIALGRVGTVDDVGPLVASLLSDDARLVNGERLEVSGGQNL